MVNRPNPGSAAEWLTSFDPLAAAASPAREEAYLDVNGAGQPVPAPTDTPIDEDLLLAAEAFFSGQAALPVIDEVASPPALPVEIIVSQDRSEETDETISAATAVAEQLLPTDGEESVPTAEPPHEQPTIASQSSPDAPTAEQPDLEAEPAMLAQLDHEGTIMPTSIPDEPIAAAGAPQEAQPPEDVQTRKVGVPSSNGKSGADEAALSAEIAAKEATVLTRQEAKEIISKLRRSDLNALDREVDALYDKVATLLSANRQEATVAFDILRRVRLILLKDPEQFADAEYLVNQVRARMNQIEQSLEGGRLYAPRIFAYQAIWMVVLSAAGLGYDRGRQRPFRLGWPIFWAFRWTARS